MTIKTKDSDSRATPDWMMDVFRDWFDPYPLNPHPEVDGLSIEWADKTYINPPYSNPAPWVFRAIEESKKGKIIVLLMRFDPTTKYFKALIEHGAHIFFCGERMAFYNPNSAVNYASPFPSILIILNGRKPFNTYQKFQEQKSLDFMGVH